MFGGSTKKTKPTPTTTDEDTASPSWLTASDHRGGKGGGGIDDEESATGESSPLVPDRDDDGGSGTRDYGGTGNNGGRAVDIDDVILTKSRKSHPDNDDPSNLSWASDDGSALSASAASSSRRKKMLAAGGDGSKSDPTKMKKSTRTMMRKYQDTIKERRRRMLSGLPRRSCCHLIFVFLNIAAVASCLCMLASQVVPLFFVQQSLLQIVLRCYISFFCVVFVVAELELPLPFVRSSQSLHNFISKGFQFTFVSIVGMEQAQATMVENAMKRGVDDPMGMEWGWFTALFVEVPAWIMLGLGVLYMLMGLCCMRPVRDRCREDYARRMEEYFEERQLQKDREEDMEDIEE